MEAEQIEPTTTIADLVAIDLEEFALAVQLGERATSSLELYRRTGGQVIERWGAMLPSEIRTPDLRRTMATESRRGRWNTEAVMLSRLLGRAVELGLIAARPKVPRYSLKNREARIMPDEYPRVLAVIHDMLQERGRTQCQPAALRALLLCLYSGCRTSEARELRWEGVHLDLRIIRCGIRKRSDTRYGLCEAAIDLLGSIPRGSPWVFSSSRDHRKPISKLNYPWARVRKEAGLSQHVTVHGIRHSWITSAAMFGSLEQVRTAIGHSSCYQTARYSHLAVRDVLPLVDAVGRAIGDLPGMPERAVVANAINTKGAR